MTFAEKLRELRDAAGFSEAKLAEASGVSFSSIHEYGLGRRSPSLAAAVKIARALETTCEAFADCEDVDQQPASSKRKIAGKSRPMKKRPPR